MHIFSKKLATACVLVLAFLDVCANEICGLQNAIYDGIFIHGFNEVEGGGLGPAYTTVVAPVTGASPTVSIVSPANGEAVGPHVQVTGTVSGPANVGVIVNGERAYTANGTFMTRTLALDPSLNELSATATTFDGQSTSTSASIVSLNVEPNAVLHADAEVGFAPLPVRFTVRLRAGFVPAIQTISIDYSTDGTPDYTGSGAIPSTSFNNPGVYTATANLTLSDNSHLVITRKVIALDLAEQRRNVCSVYANLRGRLAVQDASGAVHSLTGPLRGKLLALFTALGTQMPTVGNGLGVLADGILGLDDANVVAVREVAGIVKGYPIHFTRDAAGVWRIDAM